MNAISLILVDSQRKHRLCWRKIVYQTNGCLKWCNFGEKNANGCDIMCADVCFWILNFSKKNNKLEFETASARNYVSNIKTG